jgi:predicted porin
MRLTVYSSGVTRSLFALALVSAPHLGLAASDDTVQAQIEALQKEINELQAKTADSSSSGPGMASLISHDGPLTWKGITLYGVVDLGISMQSHGAALNPDLPAGVDSLLQKQSRGTVWNVTPGGLSQSKIGIKGTENVFDDVNAVFNLAAGFSPVSGTVANGPKSLVDNAGQSVNGANTTSFGDSSRMGQMFGQDAWAGLSSNTYGTLTFGRQNTPLLDGVVNYDPMGGSYAFSLIGYSGTTCGGGRTEDCRLDDSIRYDVHYGPVHFGALYQFPGNTNPLGGDDAVQAVLGYEQGPFSVDAFASRKRGAIVFASPAATINTLSGVVSDDVAYAIMSKINLNPVTLYGGYEHITYLQPSTPLTVGTTVEGYVVSALAANNNFSTASVFHVAWVGAKWAYSPKLDLAVAGYRYFQDNYSGMDNGVCVATAGTHCAGTQTYLSAMADYKLSKRFDTYAGFTYNRVDGGIYQQGGTSGANSYVHNNVFSPMVGARFTF